MTSSPLVFPLAHVLLACGVLIRATPTDRQSHCHSHRHSCPTQTAKNQVKFHRTCQSLTKNGEPEKSIQFPSKQKKAFTPNITFYVCFEDKFVRIAEKFQQNRKK